MNHNEVKLPSRNSLSTLIPGENNLQHYRYQVRLCALNGKKSDQNEPIKGRSYDFIAIEEANKMLKQERLKNEQEICEMKILLERQRKELLESNSVKCNMHCANQEDCDVIDLGFAGREDFESNEDVESYERNVDESYFSSSYSNAVDEEQYRECNRRSHDNAEYRTLEITFQQINENNEDLNDELNDQRDRYQSDIDEIQRMIYDLRDRVICIHRELKTEIAYFEREKTELEEVLDLERSKSTELEQQFMLARREREILEQVTIEARHQQQKLHVQELQLEQEEQERRRQQKQQLEQEEHLYHRELHQHHQQELRELEKNQEQLDDIYFDVYDSNDGSENTDNNHVPNQSEIQEDMIAIDGEKGYFRIDNSNTSGCSAHLSQSAQFTQRQMTQQQQAFRVGAKTEIPDPRQSKRESKREFGTYSHAHGMFMNFNDILV